MSGRANKRTAKLAAAFTQSQSNQPVAASILEESVVQADIVPVSEQDQVQKLISVSDSVIAAWGTDDKSAFKATCVNHVRVLLPARRIDAIGFENALRARADVGPLDSHTLVSHAVSFQSAGAVQSLVGEHMRRQSIVEANAAPLSPSTPSLVSPNKRNSVRGSTATVEAKLQVHSADGELIVTGDARFKFEMPSMLLSHMQIDETFLKEPEDATPVLTVTPQRRPSVRQTPMAMPAPTHAVIDTPDIVLDTTESSTSSKTSQLTAPPALPLPDTFSEIPATADDDCSQQLHHSPRSTVEPPGIPSLPLPCVSNQPVEDSPICTPEPVTNAPTITESAVQHVTIDESDKVLSRQSIVDSASIPVDSSLIEPPASVSIQPLLQSELKHETNDVIESADLVEIPVPTQQQRSDTTESNSQPTPDSTTSSTPDVMLVNTSESSNAEPSPPNSVDEATVLPLFEAAHVGNVDSIAHWLAVDQASVFDALDADSHSVLIVASAMGQDAVVKLLLTHERASIAPRLTPTSSKSFFSRLFTSTPTVRSIAERTDTRQWSPLMHAAANGHASVVRRLLMHISEVAVEQSDDDSRIDEALRVRSEAGSTALHIAAANGHAGVIQVLMEAVGNDSRARADYAGLTDKNGSTALLVAAACGRERAAIFLASCCTDVDRADCNGTTALMAACAIPSVDLTLTLLRAGADAGRRDNKGVSPLMRAADKGDVNIVRALLSVTGPKAAEIDAPTKNGVTALMRAARAGHAACIISLLAARPPPAIDAQDLNGLTALAIACACGQINAVDALLFEDRADVNVSDHCGNSPLMLAAENGHAEVVRILLGNRDRRHVRVDAQNAAGDTALMLACRARHAECVLALLCHEPEPRIDLRNGRGQSALDLVHTKDEKFDAAAESIRGLLSNVTQLHAVAWVPDSAADTCMQCAREFSLLARKHHCRSCGRVLCGTCSSYLGVVHGADHNRPTRICRACALSIDAESSGGDRWTCNMQ